MRSRRSAVFFLTLLALSHTHAADQRRLAENNHLAVVKKFLSSVYPDAWSDTTRLSAVTDEWLKPPPWRSGFYTVRLEKAKRPGAGVMPGRSTTTTLCVEPEDLAQTFPKDSPPIPHPDLFVNGCEIPLRVSPDVLWEGLFQFSPVSMKWFTVQGTLSRVRRKNFAIKREVDANPIWSESEIAEALKRAGARYGPLDREPFLSNVSIGKYGPFLQATKLRSVKFIFRHRPIFEGGTHPAALLWAIQTVGPVRKGKRVICGLGFEPFEGSLISLGCGQVIVTPEPAGRPSP